MRVPAAFALIAVAGCSHLPSRGPASTACNERLAGEVRSFRAEVPLHLFHFGKKTILDQDLVDRGIPEAVWWKSIFGEDDRWKLPRFRRGLYGTEKALRADRFANRTDPAMIRVEVRPECRRPDRVATTLKLHEDPRFQKWQSKNPEWSESKCLEPGGKLAVRLYAKFDQEAPTERTLRCEALIDRFFEETGIMVIHDEAVDASWYLRRPSCIATIEGTDSELLKMEGDPAFFGADQCGTSTDSLSSARIFMRMVMRVSPPAASADFRRAIAAWTGARLEMPPSSTWIADFAAAYERCSLRRRLDELRSSFEDFDRVLAEIENYEYWVKLNEEPLNTFDKLCR